MSNNRTGNNGAVLIISLWTLAVLSVVALGVGFRSGIELKLSRARLDSVMARYMAEAGVTKAVERLVRDGNVYDTINECGFTLLTDGSESAEGIFRWQPRTEEETEDRSQCECAVFYLSDEAGPDNTQMRIYGTADEDRRININISSIQPNGIANPQDHVKGVLNALIGAGNEQVVDNIMAWQTVLPEGEEENPVYNDLGYKPRHADFKAVEELMLVSGMTPAIFASIMDSVTIYSKGKINLNTASPNVLTAVFRHIAPTVNADSIVDQITGIRDNADPPHAVVADFFPVGGAIPMDAVFDKLFCVKSDSFRIDSHGYYRKVECVVTAIIKKTGNVEQPVEYLKYREEYFARDTVTE